MQPVSPVIPNKNLPEVIVAEHQDEYQDLPAIRLENGVILCRWKLDEAERKRVAETGDIYLLQWTGGGYVTPMLLQTELPDVEPPKPVEPLPKMMSAPRRTSHILNEARRHGFMVFDDQCSDCGVNVVYTQATKDMLESDEEVTLICTVCFKNLQTVNPEIEGVFLPNTAEEMARVQELAKESRNNG